MPDTPSSNLMPLQRTGGARFSCAASRLVRWCTWLTVPVLLCGILLPQVVAQDEQPTPAPSANETEDGPSAEGKLFLNFEGAPWRDVIQLLAESSGLALHITELPTGSFTYDDDSEFTPDGAINRVNLFLLPQGFTLVRSGGLLSLINLSDRRSTQQLDSLARMVTTKELADLGGHEVVKCMFSLGELKAEDAVEELTALNLMTSPAVFPRTNQLMITDTAEKLRSANKVLAGFEPDELSNGTVVESFALEHVDSEDVMVVARPHLGLATGEMIGIDVSISSDPLGKTLFVTGIEDKVKLIEGLVKAVDQPRTGLMNGVTSGTAVLETYTIEGGNVSTVYDVLQTLLAGKDVRISSDTDTIVALAEPDVQKEIAATVEQLAAKKADFEMIPLKTVEPAYVVSVLEEILDLPGPYDDPWDFPDDLPTLNADKANMRLYVRAKPTELAQIKKIVASLDGQDGGVMGSVGGGGAGSVVGGDTLRMFPLTGQHAIRTLETAARFWRKQNPVFLFDQDGNDELQPTEKTLDQNGTVAFDAMLAPPTKGRLLSKMPLSQEPAIRCQLVPRGLLLECEDSAALSTFEDHLRTIAGPNDSVPVTPVVYYLKYTRPNDALQTLAELLDGGTALKNEASGLGSGFINDEGDYVGSIISSRDGAMTLVAGPITIVADSRLNRLIVQGTAAAVERVEGYLKIIDKETGLTDVVTFGRSHVIELKYTKAKEVAEALRQAFAGRVAEKLDGGASATGASEARSNSSKSKKSSPRPTAGAGRALVPQMTIAVHEAGNSLIITAPDPLFAEVEQLVQVIDERARQSVRILDLPDDVPLERLQDLLNNPASGIKLKKGR